MVAAYRLIGARRGGACAARGLPRAPPAVGPGSGDAWAASMPNSAAQASKRCRFARPCAGAGRRVIAIRCCLADLATSWLMSQQPEAAAEMALGLCVAARKCPGGGRARPRRWKRGTVLAARTAVMLKKASGSPRRRRSQRARRAGRRGQGRAMVLVRLVNGFDPLVRLPRAGDPARIAAAGHGLEYRPRRRRCRTGRSSCCSC